MSLSVNTTSIATSLGGHPVPNRAVF